MTIDVSLVLWCMLQITLFALVTGALYLVVRRLAPSAGVAMASTSMGLVVVLTLLAASPWPRWEWRTSTRATPPVATGAAASEAADVQVSNVPRSNAAVDESSAVAAAWQAFTAALTQPDVAEPAVAATRETFRWSQLVWLALGTCLAIGLARFVWGVRAIRDLVRRSAPLGNDHPQLRRLLDTLRSTVGMQTPVVLHQSSDIATPATVGWLKPVILLPVNWPDWSDDELKAVLSHELAHIAGRDYLSWLVARFAVAIHFYHPLVHWLAGRLQLEQELAADGMAVRMVGDRQRYMQALAALALATPHHRMAGPARTLIPGRSLIMRRVEMLRTADPGSTDSTARRVSRLASACLVVLVAVGVAGVRQAATGQDLVPATNVATAPSGDVGPVERIELDVLPSTTIYVLSVRPAEFFTKPENAGLAKQIDAVADAQAQKYGVGIRQVAELMAIVYGGSKNQVRYAVRFVDPAACTSMTSAYAKEMGAEKSKTTGQATWSNQRQRMTQVDAQTVVLDHFPQNPEQQDSLPPATTRGPKWADEWRRADDQQVAVAFDLDRFRALVGQDDLDRVMREFPLQLVAPAINEIHWCVLSVQATSGIAIEGVAQCSDAKNAAAVSNTTQAMLTLLGNLVGMQREEMLKRVDETPGSAAAMRSSVEALFDLAAEFTSTAAVAVEDDLVKLSFASQIADAERIAVTTGLLLPAVEASREAARRTQSTNNIKHLMLALLNYEATYRHLPPAVVYKLTHDGRRVPRSWRVEVLPFLEGDNAAELYKQYRQDEPWDSEANLKVLDQIPAVFRSPSDGENSVHTSYFALTGPGTLFGSDEGTKFAEITDGTSRTIAVVEAKRRIPWTKPEDIPYQSNEPLPVLGGWHPSLFLAGYADGSVRAFSSSIEEQDLRNLIEIANEYPPATPAND